MNNSFISFIFAIDFLKLPFHYHLFYSLLLLLAYINLLKFKLYIILIRQQETIHT